MATEQDFQNELATLKQAIIDDQANDQKAVDALEAIIAKHVADAAAAAPAVDFSALIASVQSVKALIVPVTGADVPKTDAQTLPGETQVDTPP